MDAIALIGRILFSIMFVTSGVNHLTKRPYMAEYASAMGVRYAGPSVVVSGLMILLGGVMVAAGIWGDLGALLIVAFLLPTAYFMHAFWKVEDQQMRANQQAHFMKNMALAGGALGLLALFLCPGLGLTVTGPLFR